MLSIRIAMFMCIHKCVYIYVYIYIHIHNYGLFRVCYVVCCLPANETAFCPGPAPARNSDTPLLHPTSVYVYIYIYICLPGPGGIMLLMYAGSGQRVSWPKRFRAKKEQYRLQKRHFAQSLAQWFALHYKFQ